MSRHQPMRSHLSRLLAVLLLLLAAATAGTWAVARWHSVCSVSFNTTERCAMATAGPRLLGVTVWDDRQMAPTPTWSAGSMPTPSVAGWDDPPGDAVGALGLTFHADRTDPSPLSRFGGNRPYWSVTVPYWMLIAALGAVPAWRLSRWACRRPAHPPGCCPTCGYDLRATPEPGKALLDRCPECGAAPAAADGTPARAAG